MQKDDSFKDQLYDALTDMELVASQEGGIVKIELKMWRPSQFHEFNELVTVLKTEIEI